MGYELIISEKPNAAKKIAEALADDKVIKEHINGIAYYKLAHKKSPILVGCAVGHLFSVAEKKKSFQYPSFDIEWLPSYNVDKNSAHTKKYIVALELIAKDATKVTIACDYDIEGEVIGLNVVRYICKRDDARRMKFSTLIKDDIIEAYNNATTSLDWPQANAGETRHFLDWMYGINFSRALTLSVKAAGSFKVLSTGRVQGPALKLLSDKEKEIMKFVAKPYWELYLDTVKGKSPIRAQHKEDKFWDKKKVDAAHKKCKGKKAIVESIVPRKFQQAPPTPFDLGSLQTEVYKLFGITPKQTLDIAQKLYTDGAISYPRTSSQKLPKEINYPKILKGLAKQKHLVKQATMVLEMKDMKPNEGKKSDPAHPAIYPTGQAPTKANPRDQKVYDLICRRFFAVFGGPATRETQTLTIDVNSEKFIAKGTKTLVPGWHDLYKPFVKLSEEEMPQVNVDEELKVKKLEIEEKETQPPKRFTPASIISELEKRNLGTKATRADVIESLYKRGYLYEKSIQVTELGLKTIDVLEKYCPDMLAEDLTRHFEEEMEQIRADKAKPKKVLKEAQGTLTKMLTDFKKKEELVGKGLLQANRESLDVINTLGPCPSCKKGTFMIKRGRFGRFGACSEYPKCKATAKLPQAGEIKSMGKECEHDKFPIISVRMPNSKPQIACLKPDCKSKIPEDPKVKDQIKKIEKEEVPCPDCGKKLVIRQSFFGPFIGCSAYPKCKHTAQLGEVKKKKKTKEEKEAEKAEEKKEEKKQKQVDKLLDDSKLDLAEVRTVAKTATAAKRQKK